MGSTPEGSVLVPPRALCGTWTSRPGTPAAALVKRLAGPVFETTPLRSHRGSSFKGETRHWASS